MPVPVISALLAACSGPPALPPGDPSRPDVVLVSIDTLRADHLSSYGYGRPTSPFIDRLAAEGTRFAHARSPSPWTLPAHVTLLSGQLPHRHGVVEDTLSMDPSTPVLPQVASAAGYASGGFVSTMYVSTLFGFERGFDHFEDFGIHSEKKNLGGDVVAEDVVDRALRWWSDQPRGQPVLLFVHLYDVHYSYDPPAPYRTLFDRAPKRDDPRYKTYRWFRKHPLDAAALDHQVAQYDESIRYVDDQLARIAGAAGAAGRALRWVVTADHGEEFGERGSWGHAHTLYAEQLAIPLVVSGAGLPAGRVVEETVGLHDVAPTVASWLGGGVDADGVDLGPALAGASPPDRAFPGETSRFSTNRLSLWERGLRLEWNLADGRAELFDTAADPAERADLSASRPDDLGRMRRRVEEVRGRPWEATQGGKVLADGFVLAEGRHRALEVAPGTRFDVVPADAPVRFARGSGTAGPWQAAGGARPGADDPLRLHGEGAAASVTLDEKTRDALEALGYVQEEE